MTEVTYTIEEQQQGERIDKALSSLQSEWSHGYTLQFKY